MDYLTHAGGSDRTGHRPTAAGRSSGRYARSLVHRRHHPHPGAGAIAAAGAVLTRGEYTEAPPDAIFAALFHGSRRSASRNIAMTHPLVEQLRFARSEFRRGIEGVSDEEARRRFLPMNCLSWNIG